VTLPLAEIGLECFDFIRAEGVDPRQGAFDAVNGQPLLLEVHIVHAQQAYFGRAQLVPVGDEKERPVTLARDDPEEGAQLRLGQKVDGRRAPGVRLGVRP
jgi:hypothetical protein